MVTFLAKSHLALMDALLDGNLHSLESPMASANNRQKMEASMVRHQEKPVIHVRADVLQTQIATRSILKTEHAT